MSSVNPCCRSKEIAPPSQDKIITCKMHEAAFTSAEDPKPVLSTGFLGGRVGVTIYDPTNRAGCLIHFVSEEDIQISGPMLMEKIRGMEKKIWTQPLSVSIYGDICFPSQPLKKAVIQWLKKGIGNRFDVEGSDPYFLSTNRPCFDCSLTLDTRDGNEKLIASRNKRFFKVVDGSPDNFPEMVQRYKTLCKLYSGIKMKIIYPAETQEKEKIPSQE
jgi:hypothetical protein